MAESTQYRFHINAFTPETIPLERLAEYLGYIARIMGEKDRVHFSHLEGGSTQPVLTVEHEAIPSVRERIHLVRGNEGSSDARTALKELNKLLAQDNANGELLDADRKRVLRFPGTDAATQTEFGPVTEPGVFEGIPIKVGGEHDPVPVHLLDGELTHIIKAPRRIAKELARHLFSAPVRVEGKGRWTRNRMGEWILHSFIAQDFQLLRENDVASDFATLQAIDAEWKKLEDPLSDLALLRNGGLA